jgi:hypothetical protein
MSGRVGDEKGGGVCVMGAKCVCGQGEGRVGRVYSWHCGHVRKHICGESKLEIEYLLERDSRHAEILLR